MASAIAVSQEKVLQPSLWAEFFLHYEPPSTQKSEEWTTTRVEKMKEDVHILFKTCNTTMEKLILLETLKNLGIEQLFNEKIDIVLNEVVQSKFTSSNLHEVSLGFSLLREHGFWVSPEVFRKFKGEDGNFNSNDTREVLSLYNACHLLIPGEIELEDAISFAKNHLESIKGSLEPPLAEQVKRSLQLPLQRTFKRLNTLKYISEYKQEDGHNSTLLELAIREFNRLQHLHLKELKALTKWWKDLSGHTGLSYVRDRLVESFTWCYAIYHEEQFSVARVILTKQMVLITMMDDTYDNHATIEECRLLNEAIQRWDDSAIFLLPEYLKGYYSELLRTFNDFEGEVATVDGYRIAYVKKEFQHQSSYFMQEAEWFHQNHKPSFEEQLNLSVMSITLPTLCVGLMAGMGDVVSKEALDWAATFPPVVIASSKIARFMNDIASLKCGKTKGDVASSVECYISEHNVTREVAISRLEAMMEDDWKTMNHARFAEDRAFLPVVERIINFAASMTFFYNDQNDGFTNNMDIYENIHSLFVKPIAMV